MNELRMMLTVRLPDGTEIRQCASGMYTTEDERVQRIDEGVKILGAWAQRKYKEKASCAS